MDVLILGEVEFQRHNRHRDTTTVERISRIHPHLLLCAVRVPEEPVLTTATTCSTAVGSSLGLAGLPQWSKTQAYALNVYFTPVSSKVSLDRHRVS